MDKKSIEDKVKERINNTYINFDTTNISMDSQLVLAKFRSVLIKEMKNLFNEGNISNTMMKDLINNFNKIEYKDL